MGSASQWTCAAHPWQASELNPGLTAETCRVVIEPLGFNGGSHGHGGYPNSWMVYKGKSYLTGNVLGVPLFQETFKQNLDNPPRTAWRFNILYMALGYSFGDRIVTFVSGGGGSCRAAAPTGRCVRGVTR